MPSAKEVAIKFVRNHFVTDGKALTDKQIDMGFVWLHSMAKNDPKYRHLVDTILHEHADFIFEQIEARRPIAKRTATTEPSASPARPSTEQPVAVTKSPKWGGGNTEMPFTSMFDHEVPADEPTLPRLQVPSLRAFENAGQLAEYTPLEGF